MKLLVITGSRADYGLLEWPLKLLYEDPYFDVQLMSLWDTTPAFAYGAVNATIVPRRPDMVLMVGDRHEIMAAAFACHLERVPIAHIGGGDVTLGSYDDAMRDCVSRMASLHFPTSDASAYRIGAMGCKDVHMVGSPGVDYIMHGNWRNAPTIEQPYVVVNYQAETIDDRVDLEAVIEAIAGRNAIWIKPNMDRGNDRIPANGKFSHPEYLNLISHCEELIGNSSSILYEAPFMDVKTCLIGGRQLGRVIPFGDGKASERIVKILKEWD